MYRRFYPVTWYNSILKSYTSGVWMYHLFKNTRYIPGTARYRNVLKAYTSGLQMFQAQKKGGTYLVQKQKKERF